MKEHITKHDREVDRKNLKGHHHHKKAMHHMEKAHEALAKMHEAEAGRKYNRSEKHHRAESRGMKGK